MHIDMTNETAMKQASITAEDYFKEAVTTVSDLWGDAYVKSHPELVIAIIQAASEDYRSSCLMQIGQNIVAVLDEFKDFIIAQSEKG